MKRIRKWLPLITLYLSMTILIRLGISDAAAESTACSLTLTKAIPGSSFSLYQIQTKESDGTYLTTEAFAAYPIDLKLTDSEKMRSAISTLASYISADHPQAYKLKRADKNGTVAFTGLVPGLYVAVGETVETEDVRTVQEPVIAFLPALGEDQHDHYDLTVEIKSTPGEARTAYKVYKVWKDDEGRSRPESIEVSLYRNEIVFDTVTLSQKNNWTHTWDNLEPGYDYAVTEVLVPDGYQVEISEEAGVFTIRNTKQSPPGRTPSTTPTPTPGEPGNRIPQTGQLWWPVMVMTVLGFALIVIGAASRKKER